MKATLLVVLSIMQVGCVSKQPVMETKELPIRIEYVTHRSHGPETRTSTRPQGWDPFETRPEEELNREMANDILKVLEENGVEFDSTLGASITYDGSKVFIRNTPKNIEMAERIVESSNNSPQ